MNTNPNRQDCLMNDRHYCKGWSVRAVELKKAYIAGHMRRARYKASTTKNKKDALYDAEQDYSDWVRHFDEILRENNDG